MLLFRSRKVDPGARVESYQIYFAADAAQQLNDFAGVGGLVIYATEQHVLEGNTLAIAQGEITRRLHEYRQVPFPVDGHDALADFVVRRIERNRQLRADRLTTEIRNARDNSGCRNRHT